MKGTFYTLEASISVAMIIITIMFFLQTPQGSADISAANYKIKVHDALKFSDDIGTLRPMVLASNATGVEDEIRPYVAGYFDYEVAIYNSTHALTPVPSIDSENVITVSYFLSGAVGQFSPSEVRVYVWGVE